MLFEAACSHKNRENSDRLFNEFVNCYIEFISSDNHNIYSDISGESVDPCLRSMKLHKSPGLDGIGAEHLLHAHPYIYVFLSKLFNSMLHCGRVPHAFHFGLIAPVVKDQGADVCNSSNCRGITLRSTISKLFELCLLEIFSHFLHSSDLQFGFKKSLGCSNAMFTVQSVVDYFSKHGMTINVCTLKMSKAFDKGTILVYISHSSFND